MDDNASTAAADWANRHAIDLARVEAGSVKAVESFLGELEGDLTAIVVKGDLKPGKKERVERVIKSAQDAIGKTYSAVQADQADTLKAVAKTSDKIAAKSMNAAVGVDVFNPILTESQLTSLVKDRNVFGASSGEWWKGQDAALRDKFAKQMRQGYALGEDVDSLARRIRGTKANGYTDGIMKASRREAQALARSSVQTVSNAARLKSFEGMGAMLKGIEWISTLDTRTTPICKALDGLQWSFPDLKPKGHGKAFPGPTAHWNCRSTQTPVVASWDDLAGKKLAALDNATLQARVEEKLKKKGWSDERVAKVKVKARASMDGQVSRKMDFEAWLKSKPQSFQRKTLGPSRFALWQAGKITTRDLTDQDNRPLTVAELEAAIDAGDLPGETEAAEFPAFDKSKIPKFKGDELAKLNEAAQGKIADVLADPKAKGNSILASNLAKVQADEPGLSASETLAKAEELTAAKIAANTKSSVLSKAKKKILAGQEPTAAQKTLIASLADDELAAWEEAVGDAKKVQDIESGAAAKKKIDGAIDAQLAISPLAIDPDTFWEALDKDGLNFEDAAQLKGKLKTGVVDAKKKAIKDDVLGKLLVDPQADPYLGQTVDDVIDLSTLDPEAAKEMESWVMGEASKAKAGNTLLKWEDSDSDLKIAASQEGQSKFPQDTVKGLEHAQAKLTEYVAEEVGSAKKAASKKAIKSITGMDSPSKPALEAWMKKNDKDPQAFLDEVSILAKEKAAQATQSSILSKAKKKLAAGESMTPGQKKVFDTLGDEEKAAFESDVEAMKPQNVGASPDDLTSMLNASINGESLTSAQKAVMDTWTPSQKEAFGETVKKAQAFNAKKAAETAAKVVQTQAATDPAAKAAVDAIVEAGTSIPDPGTMTFIKTLPGSTNPRLMEDANGKRWVVKSPDQGGGGKPHLQNEAAADQIYKAAGVKVPRSEFIEIDGKPYKVSEFLDDAQTLGEWEKGKTAAQKKKLHKQISEDFVMDALMGNWDVLGQSNDNVMVLADGTPIRIDNGGALDFRAQGAKKTAAEWKSTVDEIFTLRDPSKSAGQTAKVFAGLTDADVNAQILDVVKNRDALVKAVKDQKGDSVAKVFASRIDDLEARLPAGSVPSTTAQASAKSDRFDDVPPTVAEDIKRARINGRSIPVGSNHVEDLQALTWEIEASGGKATITQLKVTDEGAAAIQKAIGDELKKGSNTPSPKPASKPVAPTTGPIPDALKQPFEAMAKTLNTHKGDKGFNAGTVQTFSQKMTSIENDIKTLKASKALSARQKAELAQLEHYAKQGEALIDVWQDYQAKGASSTKTVPWVDGITPNIDDFNDDPGVAAAKKAAASKAKAEADAEAARIAALPKASFKVSQSNSLSLETAAFTNGNARITAAADFGVNAGSYRLEFPDGVVVDYVPRTGRLGKDGRVEGLALEGTIRVRTPGEASHANVLKTLDKLEAMGLNTSAASEDYREMVWLKKTVATNTDTNLVGWKKIDDMDAGPDQIKAARAFIEQRYKVKVPERGSPDYGADGTANSFGDGPRHTYRADLPRSQAEEKMKDHTLIHEFYGSNVVTALDGMLNSGGEATATTGRIRKGVPLGTGGMSAASDIRSGGADFFFTRIRKKGNEPKGSISFKIGNIGRADAVTYTSDLYGETGNSSARKSDVATYKRIARAGSSDETIFKNGLFLLDELDTIKASNMSQRKSILDVFKKHGVTHLTDGRKIEDVVVL